MRLIAQMRSRFTSDLFGVEKDESFRSSISVINQSFGGQDLYLSVQEKQQICCTSSSKTIHFSMETSESDAASFSTI